MCKWRQKSISIICCCVLKLSPNLRAKKKNTNISISQFTAIRNLGAALVAGLEAQVLLGGNRSWLGYSRMNDCGLEDQFRGYLYGSCEEVDLTGYELEGPSSCRVGLSMM